jgi:hypothetical protein
VPYACWKNEPFDQKLRSVGQYSEQLLSSSAAAQVIGLTPQTGYRAKDGWDRGAG